MISADIPPIETLMPRVFVMNEETLNIEIRKFLKRVGVTSQREIEQAIYKAVENGGLTGSEKISVSMTLEAPELAIRHTMEGTIALE